MLKRIGNAITGIQSVVGIEIFILPDDSLSFSFCILKREKDLITIQDTAKGEGELKDLYSAIPKGIPLSLAINGKGILHKKVKKDSLASTYTAEQITNAAIPNLNAADFYIQQYESNTYWFVSIIRKESLDKLLQTLYDAGFFNLDVSLGPYEFQNIINFIDVPANEPIALQNFEIYFEGRKIKDFNTVRVKEQQSKFKLGSEEIGREFVLSYAAAIRHLLFSPSSQSLVVPSVILSKSEWKQKQIFQVAGWGALLFFLLVLLVNFFFFNHYSEKQNFYSGQLSGSESQLVLIEKLKSELKEKQLFLKERGWLHPTLFSFYTDRIGASVPGGISLLVLDIFPVDQKLSRTEKKLVINQGYILVKGKAADSGILNTWINHLNGKEWVKEVKGQTYQYDYAKKVGVFSFQIMVNE